MMSRHSWFFLIPFLLSPMAAVAQAAPNPPLQMPLQITVNSNADGPIQPDAGLTLREAIALANGRLPVEQLSPAERRQVSPSNLPGGEIRFNLPAGQTAIQLLEVLPAIQRAGLLLDGTSQPGYDPASSATAQMMIPIPVVEIAPAPGREIFRGLTLVADGITVRGLSLYGFNSIHGPTQGTPPADIFIAHRQPPPDTTQQQVEPNRWWPYFEERDIPPRDIVIENNWLGIPPSTADQPFPPLPPGNLPSAFGVSVFNGRGTIVRRNRIQNHEGSAVITSVRADGLQVVENLLVSNGLAGMPDAIRLDGSIDRSLIRGNYICGTDGAGVYLFKPIGATTITENRILFNGQRLRRAAIYLMGNDHRVFNNRITNQAGPGVVVAAYPQSDRNQITNNYFQNIEGLSIDLNTFHNTRVQDYQSGDGPNPPRDTHNRRLETGNSAVDAPRFLTQEIVLLGDRVYVDGIADPGSQIELYRVIPNLTTAGLFSMTEFYGPLSEPIGQTQANAQGRFAATLTNLKPGDVVTAIATDPQYGTSEPALNAIVRLPNQMGSKAVNEAPSNPVDPRCLTPPAPPPPPTPPPPPPEVIRLRVPRNIHFALDESTISPASAQVMDQIVAVLQQYPTIVVDLEGHTDPRASDAYNQALGLRRARAARDYLLQRGIDPARLTIRSWGESRRRTTGSSVVDYARDRRTEFIFRDVRGVEIEFEDQEQDLQIER